MGELGETGMAHCASLIAPYASCNRDEATSGLDRPRGADEDPFRWGPPLAAVGPWLVRTGPVVDSDLGTVCLGSHRCRFLGDRTANINRLRDEGGNEGEADDACDKFELRHLSCSPMLG